MSPLPPSLEANISKDIEQLGFALPYNNRTLTLVCYKIYVRESSKQLKHLWLATNMILPVLFLQMVSIMLVSSILVRALKPLHQPRIVAQILAGIILGPTILGNYYLKTIHKINAFTPYESTKSLETIGNLGLVYYIFLVGLELELKPVIRARKKALSIALVGMVAAIASGWGLFFVLDNNVKPNLRFLKAPNQQDNTHSGPLFWALALGTTSFPDVARILADLKLLNSELGQLALSSAVISDLGSWFLFILLLSLTNLNDNFLLAELTNLAFLGFCIFALRPALPKVIRLLTKNKEDKRDNYNELHVSFVLMGVLVCALITDALGTLSYVGPFVLGAIMPRGELRKLVVEKIQSFVTGILMPLFFLIIGLRTNMWFVLSSEDSFTAFKFEYAKRYVLIILLAFLPKIAGSFVAALIHKMKPRDALALGLVMNTRGLMALFILSTGRDLKTLDQRTFPAMIFAVWTLMIPIGPFLSYTYNTNKKDLGHYKNRNIRSVGSNTELRILACTHDWRNSPAIVNLIEASHPTRQSPIQVFAVQLVEMTGHTSAMLIVHDACKSNNEGSTHETRQIVPSSPSNPFELYAKQREDVYVQPLTIVSAYATMHEDICSFAEDKCINLVIVPLHQRSTLDGTMEESNPALRAVNRNIIDNAPCSVGILVDRGLGVSQIFKSNIGSHISSDDGNHRFALFFIGGADDREALAYAKRMAGHPGVDLTVIHFILNTEACLDDADYENEILKMMTYTGGQKQLDNLYLDGFRVHTMNNSSIELVEEVVNSWEETLEVIKDMEDHYDLYIMGRRHGRISTSTETSVLDSSDYDELGTLAEALVSSTFFKVSTSLLIVQQGATEEEGQSDDQEM